jgi:hypothetical protein
MGDAVSVGPDVRRIDRQLRWIGRMLVALVVVWVGVGAAIIAFVAYGHPVGVVLVATLVGNGLVWLVLAASLHHLLLRSFKREAALLVLLRYKQRRGE